jgi:hypothetical protein
MYPDNCSKFRATKDAMICVAIIALFALLAVQQSWVKRRAIGIAPQPAQSSLVFPSPVTNSFASHIGST